MYESVQPIMFMSFLDWDFIIYFGKKIWAIFFAVLTLPSLDEPTDGKQTTHAEKFQFLPYTCQMMLTFCYFVFKYFFIC